MNQRRHEFLQNCNKGDLLIGYCSDLWFCLLEASTATDFVQCFKFVPKVHMLETESTVQKLEVRA